MVRGYRFYRLSVRMFYQFIGLNVSVLSVNVCICIEYCLGVFSKIFCVMFFWDIRSVKCVFDFRLSTSSDLRRVAFDVQWEDKIIGKISIFNGIYWICFLESFNKCQIVTRILLESILECICLSSCFGSSCGCYFNGYRLFKRYDFKSM